jgi:maltose alpha-D-glucosyltransferase / alpha-amylase
LASFRRRLRLFPVKGSMPIMLVVNEKWGGILDGDSRRVLEDCLPDYLKTRRWFAKKAHTIREVRIVEMLPIVSPSVIATLLFVRVEYGNSGAETYTLPIAMAVGEQAIRIQQDLPGTVITTLKIRNTGGEEQTGILYDALWNREFARRLLTAIERGDQFIGKTGSLNASSTQACQSLIRDGIEQQPLVLRAEQSNTSIAYGERLILKVFRRVENGINPDLEIGRVLTAMKFPHSPPVAGSVEYLKADEAAVTVAILQGFVRNQGDAWGHTLDSFDTYWARCRSYTLAGEKGLTQNKSLLERTRQDIPDMTFPLLGRYVDSASQLGQRTAELHVALSNVRDDPAFSPEPFSPGYRRARYESMSHLVSDTCALLRRRLPDLPAVTAQEARRVVENEFRIQARFRAFLELQSDVQRIRCHGDYHLGQVLWTGSDFIISDFEGEPARPLSERRMKHAPILDLAGMLRSFQYAPYAALSRQHSDWPTDGDNAGLEQWIQFWTGSVSMVFLKAYLGIAEGAPFLPGTQADFQVLLDAHLLEKAVYEIGYELNNRPEWVRIPLRGVTAILETS